MSGLWNVIGPGFSYHPAASLLLVAGIIVLGGKLLLRAIALFLAYRLSRRAIEQGYPVEAASGREFYFRIPARGAGSAGKSNIARPRPTASGARVRTLRAEKRCTLAKLSEATGIPASRLSQWETGRGRLLDGEIDAIAEALHLTAEDTYALKALLERDTEVVEDE